MLKSDHIATSLTSLRYLVLFFPLIPFDMSVVENARGHAMRAALIALMLTFGLPAGASVWDLDNFKLYDVKSIQVVLNDNAKGACWTNLKEVREYAEEKLRMQGAKINSDATTSLDLNTYAFRISVNSARLYKDGSGPCYGNVTTEIITYGFVNGSWHVLEAGSSKSIHPSFTNLNQAVIGAVSDFIAEFK